MIQSLDTFTRQQSNNHLQNQETDQQSGRSTHSRLLFNITTPRNRITPSPALIHPIIFEKENQKIEEVEENETIIPARNARVSLQINQSKIGSAQSIQNQQQSQSITIPKINFDNLATRSIKGANNLDLKQEKHKTQKSITMQQRRKAQQAYRYLTVYRDPALTEKIIKKVTKQTKCKKAQRECNNCLKRCHNRFLCRQRSNRKERWDLFIMILATWNVYLLPVEVSFEPEVIIQTGQYI
ncbi:UNKNOWN [Stylonychia lemnae]|uniref:Uncharacterized protein n=1 Tax=Stylonychia lemnae TaxID=5949 RepID=A0A077ZQB8_STYLE|nr:UNKNOWN [Stylonychia lemnae]|eukprot:CDW71654.1 UNKNOWN [Stylonychia lemnae]